MLRCYEALDSLRFAGSVLRMLWPCSRGPHSKPCSTCPRLKRSSAALCSGFMCFTSCSTCPNCKCRCELKGWNHWQRFEASLVRNIRKIVICICDLFSMNFRLSSILSVVLFLVFHVVTFSWWFYPTKVDVVNSRIAGVLPGYSEQTTFVPLSRLRLEFIEEKKCRI